MALVVFGAYDSYPPNLTYKMIGLTITWRLRTLAFAALALAVFGAIECPPWVLTALSSFLQVPNVNLLRLDTNFLPKPIYSSCQLRVQVLVLKANLFLDKSMFEAICCNFPNLRKLTVDDMSEIDTAVQKLSLLKNLSFLSLRLDYGNVSILVL